MTEATASDLLFRPALELAGLVHEGEISSRELVQAALERIEAQNPRINAFVDVDAEGALNAAGEIGSGDPRPFAGVPIAIKNNRAVAGRRLTYAAPLMGDFVADYDHNVVARLRRAGFVIVGTTALPEYGILPTSESTRLGPTRNPWDLERTPGGSSGGSAAAVAAGMLPLAHANDGGGSTRIPAACCGLVGLKPQRGRISLAPEMGDHPLVHDGVLTRTVADTAAVLDLLAGYEVGDATWAPAPPEPFARAAQREPKGLRIAMATVSPLPGAEVKDACVGGARQAAELLSSLGHHVEEVTPPWRDEQLLALFSAEFATAIALSIAHSQMIAGREATPEDMEPLSWAMWQMASSMNAVQAAGARVQLQGFARSLVAFLEPYDVLLTPALAEPPLPLGVLDASAPEPMATFARSGQFTPFTATFNVTGQPALSLPLFEDEGLPLGIQLVGRPAGEGPLLALAAQLEAARPWAQRRAPL